ncbi:MAG: prepilin peptidase [Geminicoccaceae bacterium]
MSVHHVLAVLLAPLIGSFIGVVVERLPLGLSIIRGRSRCDHCFHELRPRDLVPLVSYLCQRGRCSHCGEQIRTFYPIVELAAVLVAASAAIVLDGTLYWLSLGLGFCLLTLAFIDLRHLILPDVLTLPLILSGLAVAFHLRPEVIQSHIIGAALGFLIFAGIAWLYRRLRGRDGLGLGDAKLLAAAGAWLGWEGLSGVVLLAATAAMVIVSTRGVLGDRVNATTELAFGAYLALAFWISWLFGPLVVA